MENDSEIIQSLPNDSHLHVKLQSNLCTFYKRRKFKRPCIPSCSLTYMYSVTLSFTNGSVLHPNCNYTNFGQITSYYVTITLLVILPVECPSKNKSAANNTRHIGIVLTFRPGGYLYHFYSKLLFFFVFFVLLWPILGVFSQVQLIN